MSSNTNNNYPLDEAILDFMTSCTREEAVAKLLGWMRGSLRYKNQKSDITQDQLVYVDSLPYSLQEILLDLRYGALTELYDAKDESAISEKVQAVLNIDSLINKAGRYLCCIDDELAKGTNSTLRIDQQESEQSEEVHITLASLDAWAKSAFPEEYICMFDVTPTTDYQNITRELASSKDNYQSKEMSHIKANNLRVTFALLVEAFADKNKYRNGDEVNISQIAKAIEEFGTQLNRNNKIDNQSAEAIKDRIEDAKKTLSSKLPSE